MGDIASRPQPFSQARDHLPETKFLLIFGTKIKYLLLQAPEVEQPDSLSLSYVLTHFFYYATSEMTCWFPTRL